jgi:hypothetical protein
MDETLEIGIEGHVIRKRDNISCKKGLKREKYTI